MPEAPAQALANYNAQRMYDTTITLYDKSKHSFDDAHFHFQGVLAHLMLNRPADDAIKRLRASSNFTPTIEGDLYRDVALSYIRTDTSLGEAAKLLDKAFTLHANDPQRTAVDRQALARLQEARHEIGPAYGTIKEAVAGLQSLGPRVDSGWLASTAFHATRIAMKMRQRHAARDFARIAITHEPLVQRQVAALMMVLLPGQLGVKLVERLG